MMQVRACQALASVSPSDWNRLTGDDQPLLRHEFLAGLEEFDCLAPQGWQPMHLLATRGARLVGAMPLYLKANSVGEFVFDWSWAEAYERAGGRYYPKLVNAVPFSPVTGPRLLVDPQASDPGAIRAALVEGATGLAAELGLSSVHCLFPADEDRTALAEGGLLARMGVQYHWHNAGYPDFDAFLAALSSKRRKQIKRERREVAAAGIDFEIRDGATMRDADWKVFHEFYCSTFERRWGEPRLTLPFFRALGLRMPAQTLVFLARRAGEYVAGAFALRGRATLYGRHWGCSEQFPFLHFELCYYRTIEYCIAHGLARLDAGAQGEHKIPRGFLPVRTWSAHWIADPRFRAAVADFLRRETRVIESHIEELDAHSPYRESG